MTRTVPSRWAARTVELAARLLPAAQRQRYALEFVAELYGMGRGAQLRHAVQVLASAWALRAALDEAGSPVAGGETVMIIRTRPWRCRLRWHEWDERENPETRERYEICLRCDAYRDHPRAAPGAGAAGVTGGGIF